MSNVQWFQRVMWIGIVANLVIGVIGMIWPMAFIGLFGLERPYPEAWPRFASLLLLLLTVFYIPGAVNPLAHRYSAFLAIFARWCGFFFFLLIGGGYLWFALYDAIFAVPLSILYWRANMDELMSQP